MVKNGQRYELLGLKSQLKELEQRLWWRTVTLSGCLMLSGLVAVMMAFMLFQDTEPPLTALEENLSSTISAGLGSGAASSKLSAEGAKQSREAASSENTPAASREVAQAQDEGRQLGRSSMTATARNLAETPAQTANAKAQEETEKTGQQVDGVREAEIQAEVVRAELAATQRYIRELEAAIRSAGAHHELVPLR